MRIRFALPLAALLAAGELLGACSDEKKGEPAQMTPPAPASDPAKPADGTKPTPAKPADEKH